MIYLLDTNVISDLIANVQLTFRYFDLALEHDDTVGLCQPVLYEVQRGFFRRHSPVKSKIFNENILPRLTLIPLTDADWLQAAQRLDATLVTADDDFNPLPIKRVNWRVIQPS